MQSTASQQAAAAAAVYSSCGGGVAAGTQAPHAARTAHTRGSPAVRPHKNRCMALFFSKNNLLSLEFDGQE